MSDVARPNLLLLSGPNLNLLGEREPAIYGTATLADHVELATATADRRGFDLTHLQSNHEGELVDAIHRARHESVAVVINAGALTHYAWSLHDALAAYPGVVVELHLSNPMGREPWRHTSVISPVADALICGLGGVGYRLAVEAVAELLAPPSLG
jgi:3-dehydroquinate dehydratase-2